MLMWFCCMIDQREFISALEKKRDVVEGNHVLLFVNALQGRTGEGARGAWSVSERRFCLRWSRGVALVRRQVRQTRDRSRITSSLRS
jgi:hypothetical protein